MRQASTGKASFPSRPVRTHLSGKSVGAPAGPEATRSSSSSSSSRSRSQVERQRAVPTAFTRVRHASPQIRRRGCGGVLPLPSGSDNRRPARESADRSASDGPSSAGRERGVRPVRRRRGPSRPCTRTGSAAAGRRRSGRPRGGRPALSGAIRSTVAGAPSARRRTTTTSELSLLSRTWARPARVSSASATPAAIRPISTRPGRPAASSRNAPARSAWSLRCSSCRCRAVAIASAQPAGAASPSAYARCTSGLKSCVGGTDRRVPSVTGSRFSQSSHRGNIALPVAIAFVFGAGALGAGVRAALAPRARYLSPGEQTHHRPVRRPHAPSQLGLCRCPVAGAHRPPSVRPALAVIDLGRAHERPSGRPEATGYSARDGSPGPEGKRDRHQQHPARRG